jgi:hypothetical protein
MMCPVCGDMLKELRENRVILFSYKVMHVERQYKCPNGCEFPFERQIGEKAILRFGGREI